MQTVNASVGQPNQIVQVIGFGRRLAAYAVDVIVLQIINVGIRFLTSILGYALNTANMNLTVSWGLGLALQCFSFIISAAYFVVFWATTGQTPGKMALGIKVISTDGTPVSWDKAILRFIGYFINDLGLSLGFIWAAFDAKRQGWHDKIAGTYVVRQETTFAPGDAVTIEPSDKRGPRVLIILAAIMLVLVLVATAVMVIFFFAIRRRIID